MQKFEFLRQPLLGELAMSWRERKKEREKMPSIVATYVYASSQGQRTHSARTKMQFLVIVSVKHLVAPVGPAILLYIRLRVFQEPPYWVMCIRPQPKQTNKQQEFLHQE